MAIKKNQPPASETAALRRRAEQTLKDRTGIVLSGRVVNGKVELDETTLNEISTRFPDANISFVAVNAPFDPESRWIDSAAV